MLSKRLVGLHQRVRYTCGILVKCNSKATVVKSTVHLWPLQNGTSFCGVRHASTNTVIPPVITKAVESATNLTEQAQSTSSLESVVEVIGPIPEIPGPPLPKVIEILSNGEPSMSSLGLGGFSPYGILQQILELTHLTSGLSWGWTIVLVAVTIRALCFKLVIRQRQESAKFAAVVPQLQYLQQKMTEARQQNNLIQASRYAMELSEFTKINPSMLGPLKYGLVQAFILLSFTGALREMCNLPMESLQTGGFGLVVDLTMKDPSMILPGINAVLLYLHFTSGGELKAMFPTKSSAFLHTVMAGAAGALFFVSMNFQGAIVLYWISSQIVTVITHRILSQPKVKEYYNLNIKGNPEVAEMMKKENLKKLQSSNKLGFWARVKEAQVNSRLADEVKRRDEIDSTAFSRAGLEPIRKTYKYDVTKLKK